MATETFNIINKVDNTLPVNAEQLLSAFLVDIPLSGLNGQRVTYDTIEDDLLAVMEQVQEFLSIRLPYQKIAEEHDFVRDEFERWGFLRVDFFIAEACSVTGLLGGEINYPTDWISYARNIQERKRQLFLVPARTPITQAVSSNSIVYSGAHPIFVFSRSNYIPNYWQVEYMTGFKTLPKSIAKVIGKLAAINLLAVLGDITFGAGIASKSISIDGLSQSIGTTQSAENSLYSARIRQYADELMKRDIPALVAEYRASIMTVI